MAFVTFDLNEVILHSFVLISNSHIVLDGV